MPKKIKEKKLVHDWTPRRRGPFYCSPKCGSNCSFEQYQAANKAAEHCLKRMRSKGWTISVTENMGWYWCIQKAGAKLTVRGGQIPYRDDPYSGFHAMLSNTPNGGDMDWHCTRRFRDPNDAVDHVLRLAKRRSNFILKLIAEVQ